MIFNKLTTALTTAALCALAATSLQAQTLQDLIDTGGSIVAGDVTFDNFQLEQDIGTLMIPLDQIQVSATPVTGGATILFDTSAIATVADLESLIGTVGYNASASAGFGAATLTLIGPGTGNSGLVDSFLELSDSGGSTVAELNVFDDAALGDVQLVDSDTFNNVGSAQSSLSFSVFGPASFDGVAVTYVVPAPGAAALLIGSFVMTRRRRRG